MHDLLLVLTSDLRLPVWLAMSLSVLLAVGAYLLKSAYERKASLYAQLQQHALERRFDALAGTVGEVGNLLHYVGHVEDAQQGSHEASIYLNYISETRERVRRRVRDEVVLLGSEVQEAIYRITDLAQLAGTTEFDRDTFWEAFADLQKAQDRVQRALPRVR